MRLFFTAFVTLFWAGHAIAECTGPSFFDRLTPEEHATLEARTAATPFPQGLIWEARRGQTLLTVVGTIHIYDPALEPIATSLSDTIAAADLVLVEATPREEAEMQAAMAADPSMIFLTDGPTLPEQLDEETWRAIAEATRARQIPPFLAAKMKPWYLALSLSIPPCAVGDLAAGVRGLDHLIMQKAKARGVPLQALEPWTTLIDVMRSGTPAEQLEMLQLSLLAPALQSEMFVAMLDAYFAEDIALIWEASRISAGYVDGINKARAAALFEQTEQLLLIDRNLRWMPVIAEAAAQHDAVMVAVGAAHLPGDFGVLQLLQNDGWTISRR